MRAISRWLQESSRARYLKNQATGTKMKSRKIIDSFMFYNELSTLNMRLHELDDYVDYFVIVEANLTHSGNPKSLYFDENKSEFAKFSHKIIYHLVDDFPADSDAWDREFHQRNSLVSAVKKVPNISAGDIVLMSDADEIPNPTYLDRSRFDDDSIFVFNQRLFYYDFTCENPNGWPGTTSIPYKYFDDIDLNHMRKRKHRTKDNRVTYIPQKVTNDNHAGWHCTCFGGVDRIITKLESYSHQRYNKPKFKDRKVIERLVREKKDLVFRWKKKYRLSTNDESSDPNLPKYRKLIYEDTDPGRT